MLDGALRLVQAAAGAAAEIGDRRTEAQAVRTAATVELRLGRPKRAAAGQIRALALAAAVGDRYTEAEALIGLARAHAADRQGSAAESAARKAADRAGAAGFSMLAAEAADMLASVAGPDRTLRASRPRPGGTRNAPMDVKPFG